MKCRVSAAVRRTHSTNKVTQAMTAILVEAFGSIVNEELRVEDVSLEDAMGVALQRIDNYSVLSLEGVDKIYTGMNGDVTHALQDAVEALDMDVEIQPFYPNVKNIQEEDDVDYQTAWKQGFTWRNNRLFIEDEDDDRQETVEAAVRIGDAGNNGEALLQHARRKGVVAIDINLDDLVERDLAYASSDDAAAAEA